MRWDGGATGLLDEQSYLGERVNLLVCRGNEVRGRDGITERTGGRAGRRIARHVCFSCIKIWLTISFSSLRTSSQCECNLEDVM